MGNTGGWVNIADELLLKSHMDGRPFHAKDFLKKGEFYEAHNSDWDRNYKRALDELESLDLINVKPGVIGADRLIEITIQGIEIIEKHNSFSQFLSHRESEEQSKKSEKERSVELTNLQIEQLKRDIWQLKYWWILVIIAGVVGFVTGNFELILSWVK